MKGKLGIVTAEHCCLRGGAGSGWPENKTGIEDEIFSGWAVRILEEADPFGWVRVETHYGYEGYVNIRELHLISPEELELRQDKERFFRVGIGEADLLSEPRVQGLPLELLLKNAIVELLPGAEADHERRADVPGEKEQEAQDWCLVRTAAGREGYLHISYLRRRRDDDRYLLDTSPEEPGRKAYFRRRFAQMQVDEDQLRASIVRNAKAYLGTQYRWGGKSSQGLDCSGLVFMSYMESGVLIYRDAKVLPEYPVQEIDSCCVKPGDLLFFPGHVTMYLGDGRYIHSTAYAKTPYVTINSLNPEDEDYRADLKPKLTGCGSLFAARKGEDE